MSVEDLQNWVKRQQELPQKPMGKLRYEWEVLKTSGAGVGALPPAQDA